MRDATRRHGRTVRARSALAARYRLYQVLGGAEREPLSALVEHRDDDHRDIGHLGVRLQRREHVPAVELGEDDVEHDPRRAQLAHRLEAGLTVASDLDREPGAVQVQRQQVDRLLLVLDQQDRGHVIA